MPARPVLAFFKDSVYNIRAFGIPKRML